MNPKLTNTGPRPGRYCWFAPEIPSVSATFVQNEIQAIRGLGVPVLPVSMHRVPREHCVNLPGPEPIHLYALRGLDFPLAAIAMFAQRPRAFAKTLGTLASDLLRAGRRGWKLPLHFLAGAKLARVLMEHGISHLHVHFAHAPTQIGMYASLLSGIPYSFTAHANDIFQRGLLLREKAERAAKVIMISRYNLRYFRRIAPTCRSLRLVRCGFSPPRTQVRNRRPGSLRIGSLGRLVEKKGMDNLIRAFAQVHAEYPRTVLEIAGGGPLQADLQSLVKNLGLEEAIEFRGPLRHDQVQQWMRQLDVFALACKRDSRGDQDGIPVVLMEAMGLGIPAVSTRISGIPELIENGGNGLLAEPDDDEDFARTLRAVIRDENLRVRLGGAGRRFVAGNYGLNKNAAKLMAVLGENQAPAVTVKYIQEEQNEQSNEHTGHFAGAR